MYTLNIPVGLERRELKRRKENQFGIMISNCKKRKGERERKKKLWEEWNFQLKTKRREEGNSRTLLFPGKTRIRKGRKLEEENKKREEGGGGEERSYSLNDHGSWLSSIVVKEATTRRKTARLKERIAIPKSYLQAPASKGNESIRLLLIWMHVWPGSEWFHLTGYLDKTRKQLSVNLIKLQ